MQRRDERPDLSLHHHAANRRRYAQWLRLDRKPALQRAGTPVNRAHDILAPPIVFRTCTIGRYAAPRPRWAALVREIPMARRQADWFTIGMESWLVGLE